jgi:hypothetical protein
MFAFGTSVEFDELPLTVKLAAAVSASPTVKAIAPVVVSSLIVWDGMFEIVGAVLGERIAALKATICMTQGPGLSRGALAV